MACKHPLADSDARCPAGVTAPDGETYPVVDGVVQCPADVGERLREVWRERGRLDDTPAEEDGPPDAETCDAVKQDGEVCGRKLPCPYHDTDEEA